MKDLEDPSENKKNLEKESPNTIKAEENARHAESMDTYSETAHN